MLTSFNRKVKLLKLTPSKTTKQQHMGELKKQVDYVFDGFFYFFGFTENPAKEEVKSIMDETPSEKIKADIKRMNKDYREKYLKMRKEMLCLE
jgi:hypothetical protein